MNAVRYVAYRYYALALVILSFTLAGCLVPGMDKNNSSLAIYTSNLSLGGGMATFESAVFPVLRQNCAGCHGTSQAPLHSVPDVGSAYSEALIYVDFGSPANSTLVQRGGNPSHCGSCSSSVGSSLQSGIELWGQAESSGGSGGGGGTGGTGGNPPVAGTPGLFKTAAISLPANMETITGNNWARLRYVLSSVTPAVPGLANALFEVEIQQFTVPMDGIPGSLRLRRPRLGTPTSPAHVQGIKIMLNGVYDSLVNDWANVDTVVAPMPFPNPLPTNSPLPFPDLANGDTMILPNANPAAQGNTLQISFDDLSVANAVTCQNLQGWINNVRNTGAQTRCYNCHSNTNNAAYQRFRMDPNDNAGTCLRFLIRADRSIPTNSSFIVYPKNGTNGHNTINIPQTEINSWITWINSEP